MTQSHASLRDDYAVSLPAMDALVAALNQESGVFGRARSPEQVSVAAASRCTSGYGRSDRVPCRELPR